MTPIFTLNEIHEIIRDAGPILKLHSGEKYRLDYPDYFLAEGKNELRWGIVRNEDDFDQFSIEVLGSETIGSSNDLLPAVAKAKKNARSGDPDFRYWIQVSDDLKAGNMGRAKSLVCIRQREQTFVDLQFFFFYAFNGPGKFRLTFGEVYTEHVGADPVGRHYGDMEHVTLRVARVPDGGRNWKVVAVYLSRHDQTRWVSDLRQLRWKDQHPIVCSARDSHAHYENPGDHYYKRVASRAIDDPVFGIKIGTFAVDLYDMADDGPEFDTSKEGKTQIVFSNLVEHQIQKPGWWDYDGRWGQREKLEFTYRVPVVSIDAYTFKEVGAGPGPISRFENEAETFAAVTAGATKNIEVFGIGRDERLYHCFYDGWWQPWDAPFLKHNKVHSVATSVKGGNMELFVVDDAFTLHHHYLDGSGWHSSNAPFRNCPRVTSIFAVAGNHTEVFAIGLDGTLYHNFFDGNWHDWNNSGGALRVKSVTAGKGRNLEAFAIGTNEKLYHNYLDEKGWHQWNEFGGPPKTKSVVTGCRQNFEVFAIGNDNRLFHCFFDGRVWQPWVSSFLNCPPVQSATVAAGSNLEVFAIGLDGMLYHNWLDGTWHQWENYGGWRRFRHIAGTTFGANVEMFGVGDDGTMYHRFLDQASGWHEWEGPFTR